MVCPQTMSVRHSLYWGKINQITNGFMQTLQQKWVIFKVQHSSALKHQAWSGKNHLGQESCSCIMRKLSILVKRGHLTETSRQTREISQFQVKSLHIFHCLSVDYIQYWCKKNNWKSFNFMQFYLFGVIQHWLGEFCRLEHQFQFGEVDPPTENFIDLIRSKSNLPKENGPSSFHIFHLQCFLITICFFISSFVFCVYPFINIVQSGDVCVVAAVADSYA